MDRFFSRVRIVQATLLLGLLLGGVPARALTADPHYCTPPFSCSYWAALHFAGLEEFGPGQQALLRDWLPDPTGTGFQDFGEAHDDEVAAFLAVTHAMTRVQAVHLDGSATPLLAWVTRINRLKGDRIMVRLASEPFLDWATRERGAFRIERADGGLENGRFTFRKHTSIGSELHHGYDIQAYTSVSRVPRLQINYRYSDSEADIDLDGRAPFIWGFIPNPFHMTYANSDPRQWLSEYLKKYGDPGFLRRRVHFKSGSSG